MGRPSMYPLEMRERAVRLVRESERGGSRRWREIWA